MRNVFIFVPAFGHNISATTFLTSHAITQTFASKGISAAVSTLSFPDIAELRSMALTMWYDSMKHADYLLFVDADMGFPPEMVLDMMLLDEPVVGTIYPQRRLPLSWAGSGTGDTHTERRGNFMVVEGVGMGCTLIRRDAVDAMMAKMPHLVDTRMELHPAGQIMKSAGSNRLIRAFEKLDIPERGLVSEDLSFCIRHRECGGKVWGAIGYKVSHVGPYDYAACYLEEIAKAQAVQEQAAQPLIAPPPAAEIAHKANGRLHPEPQQAMHA